jgi:hypothetical protein
MADEPVKKRVDESWKEQAEREKQAAPGPAGPSAPQTPGGGAGRQAAPAHDHAAEGEQFQARFDLFVSGLAMETLIALGDMPHPVTRKQGSNLPQAKYLIDLLGVIEDKTRGNLSVDEDKLLKDALYQLRMRYMAKAGGAPGAAA